MNRLGEFLSCFENKAKAYKIFLRINSLSGLVKELFESLDEIKQGLGECANPDLAFQHLERFIENSTSKSTVFEIIRNSKIARDMLFGIFSQSNTLSTLIINHSEYFYWLLEDYGSAYKSKEIFQEEIFRLIKNKKTLDEKKFFLREYRKKEYLRIAAKEIIDSNRSIEVYNELSELADAFLEVALHIAYEKEKAICRDFCIISLGKLGAKELNFSSDIDIIFVHTQNELTQDYCKIAQDVVSIIGDAQFGSFVFRIDARLRPFGNNSALSLSLDEYENYYFSFGQVWERFALLRARFSAGSIAVAKNFFSIIKPFVYLKNIDINYIEEIRSIRYKIKINKLKDLKSEVFNSLKTNVKLGLGGIREVEFITQYFQLIYGGKDNDLNKNSTVDILETLYNKNYLKLAKELKESYIFLRLIEHKLQLKDEQQTAQLPSTRKELAELAKKLKSNLEDFLTTYNKITDQVHSIYKSIFYTDEIPIFSSQESLEDYFEDEFDDFKQIAMQITEISRKSQFSNINPALIKNAVDVASKKIQNLPKDTKNLLFLNIVSGINTLLPTYYDVLLGNEFILDIILKTFSIGLYRKIALYPFLTDEFFYINQTPEILDLSLSEKERLEFNIALKFLSGKLDKESKGILSEFAKAYIIKMINQLKIGGIIVLAYGKLGMGELFINSDLDLVFIADQVNEKKISNITLLIKELKKLYEVDLRLRPFGEKGLILCDLAFFKDYLQKYAKDWEKIAIQKASIIYSDFDNDLTDCITKFVSFIDKKSIKEMKKLIETHKGFDIKSEKGGITDIEFIVQFLCTKYECFEFGNDIFDVFLRLSKENEIAKDIQFLKATYVYFSNILNLTRLIPNDFKDRNFIAEYVLGQKNISANLKRLQLKVTNIFDNIFTA